MTPNIILAPVQRAESPVFTQPRASEAPRGGTKGKSRGTNQCAQTIMHVTEPGFTPPPHTPSARVAAIASAIIK